MYHPTVKPLLRKVFFSLLLLCLFTSFGSGNAAAQSGTVGSGTTNPPKVYLPYLAKSCPVVPAKQIQCVDCPKDFYNMTGNSLRFDANNHPHIAYGGDHLYYTWNDGTIWHPETVDAAPGVGIYASLALDSASNPAVTYYDRFNGYLKFARWNGSSWAISVIDGVSYNGLGSSLVFDSANVPMVAYMAYSSSGTYSVKFARLEGSTWTIYPLVDNDTGKYLSLALDKQGKPHISYYRGDFTRDGGLMYASWSGSAWTLQIVENDTDIGAYNSLAFDRQGNPHISYYDFYNVKYASWTGSAWSTEIALPTVGLGDYVPTSLAFDSQDTPMIGVAYSSGYYPHNRLTMVYKKNSTWSTSGFGAGLYVSLAVDAAGKPGISYYDDTTNQLAFNHLTDWGAAPNPDTWSHEEMDHAAQVGIGVQMAVDSTGKPHIVYLNATVTPRQLEYATLVNLCWQSQVVTAPDSVPAESFAIAVDASGRPRIAYVDVYNHKIVYTSWNGAAWVPENAADDTTGNQGTFERYLSMALDKSGNPFISFYDGASISLKMAKKVDGAWTVETVDKQAVGFAGYYNAIAVDSLGHPHISYHSYPNSLHYAHWNGSSWIKATPDSNYDVGLYTSIAIDASDRASICYSDGIADTLKYTHDTGGGWDTKTLTADAPHHLGDSMDACSIKYSPGNVAYISFYDRVSRHLQLAHQSGSIWVTETLDANGDSGEYNALAFSGPTPLVAYFHTGNLDLNFVQWAP